MAQGRLTACLPICLLSCSRMYIDLGRSGFPHIDWQTDYMYHVYMYSGGRRALRSMRDRQVRGHGAIERPSPRPTHMHGAGKHFHVPRIVSIYSRSGRRKGGCTGVPWNGARLSSARWMGHGCTGRGRTVVDGWTGRRIDTYLPRCDGSWVCGRFPSRLIIPTFWGSGYCR